MIFSEGLEYGYTGWNSNLAGISGYSGKTNILLDGIINPVSSTDQNGGSKPFDVANTGSLYEIPVAYTNFFMPWINSSTSSTAQIRNGTIFRT
uniref:Uncharacterized protein n=1 Tax=Romanomermis culicivorax TaxID=13658 RepID=A0A915HDU3_ROMCU